MLKRILACFRLGRRPVVPPVIVKKEMPEGLEKSSQQQTGDASAGGTGATLVSSKELRRLVADFATSLWRVRRRVLDAATGEPQEAFRLVHREVQSGWDSLIQAGVEVLDHAGEAFDPGMSLSVLAYEPTDGIDRERVVETIKPTIYFKGEWIQMGHVIVGTPRRNGDRGGAPEPGPLPTAATCQELTNEPLSASQTNQTESQTDTGTTPSEGR